jgi:hypothetical protein
MGKWLAFSVKNLSKTLIPSALATSTDYWQRKIVESLTELQVGNMQSKKISCRSSTKRM